MYDIINYRNVMPYHIRHFQREEGLLRHEVTTRLRLE